MGEKKINKIKLFHWALSTLVSSIFFFSTAPKDRDYLSLTGWGPRRHGNHYQVSPAGRRPRQSGRCPGHGPGGTPPRLADPSPWGQGAEPLQARGAVTGTHTVCPWWLRGGGGRDGATGERRPQLPECSAPGPHQSEGRMDHWGDGLFYIW